MGDVWGTCGGRVFVLCEHPKGCVYYRETERAPKQFSGKVRYGQAKLGIFQAKRGKSQAKKKCIIRSSHNHDQYLQGPIIVPNSKILKAYISVDDYLRIFSYRSVVSSFLPKKIQQSYRSAQCLIFHQNFEQGYCSTTKPPFDPNIEWIKIAVRCRISSQIEKLLLLMCKS